MTDKTTSTPDIQAMMPQIVIAILLLITVLGGYAGSRSLAEFGEEQVTDESDAFVKTLSAHVTSELTESEDAVHAMAGSPAVIEAFAHNDSLDDANAVLDRFHDSFGVAVCYLMDQDGTTIASSNRDSNSSFVGGKYGFRPYFQQAISGNAGRYFALGVTSGTRGFYASYPVMDENDTIVGVAVIKKELDDLENHFSEYKYCFLTSPEGVIFLSGSSDMLFKTIGGLSDAQKTKLNDSNEFGPGPFKKAFDENAKDGDDVNLDSEMYLVTKQTVNEAGWAIVLYNSLDERQEYGSTGCWITIFVVLIILVGAVSVQRAIHPIESVHSGHTGHTGSCGDSCCDTPDEQAETEQQEKEQSVMEQPDTGQPEKEQAETELVTEQQETETPPETEHIDEQASDAGTDKTTKE